MEDFSDTSDSALVVAIGRWQESAMAEVYRRHGAAVHNLARRVLSSKELADEVVQEIFIDLWNRPEQFDPTRGSLRTLLLTKAHGKSVDFVRAETARRAREQKTAINHAKAGYDIDRFAWDLAIEDQVKTALDNLPDDERAAIEMAYFGAMTYREVASTLGVAEGTIKSRIRAGLKTLKSQLNQQEIEVP